MKKFYSSRRLALAIAAAATLASGCGNSDNFVFTNTNINTVPVVLAPVANNDTVTALGNATLNQLAANGVLNNDTLNGAVISSFDATSAQSGAVVLNADGSFTYTPVFGFTGTDSFTYTLSNSAGDSTATVTVNVPNEGFFVDNSVAPGGNGSQAAPFNTLAQAIAVAGNGDTIFVFRGNGTSTGLSGAVNLPQGVSLIGEGQGLVVAQTIVPVGTAPLLTGPITCNGDNTVSGLNLTGSSGDAIFANGVNNITVHNNTFGTPDVNGNQVDFDNVGGTVAITNNTFGTPGANEECIQVETNVNGTFTISGNSFSNDNSAAFEQALEFDTFGSAVCTVVANSNTITASSNVNSFGEGLDLEAQDTSNLTVTLDGNNITNVSGDAIDTDASDTATLSVTATNNTLTTPGVSGLDTDSVNDTGAGTRITYSASNNVISGAGENGVFLGDFEGQANVTFTGNQISGSTSDGIFCSTNTNGAALYFIRDNTVSTSGSDAVECEPLSTSSMCIDITGNTLDDDINMDNGAGATLNVERFLVGDGGPLDAVNTFSAGGPISTGTITSRAAGFCNL